jgi:hypothetical protein
MLIVLIYFFTTETQGIQRCYFSFPLPGDGGKGKPIGPSGGQASPNDAKPSVPKFGYHTNPAPQVELLLFNRLLTIEQ